MRSQKRLASEILKVGENRVWMDPHRAEDIEMAITREEVRRLIHEGAIKPRSQQGVSRSRVRVRHKKKKIGRGIGSGSREGSKTARTPRKKSWINRIRAIRRNLRELRRNRMITRHTYRQLYLLAKGGSFDSVSDLNQHIDTYKLQRRR